MLWWMRVSVALILYSQFKVNCIDGTSLFWWRVVEQRSNVFTIYLNRYEISICENGTLCRHFSEWLLPAPSCEPFYFLGNELGEQVHTGVSFVFFWNVYLTWLLGVRFVNFSTIPKSYGLFPSLDICCFILHRFLSYNKGFNAP